MKLSAFLSKKYLIVIGLIVLSCISFFVFPLCMTEGFYEGGVGAQVQANTATVGTGSNGEVAVKNGKDVSKLGGSIESDATFFTYTAHGTKNGLIKDSEALSATDSVKTDLFTQQAAFGASNRLRIPIPKVPADHTALKTYFRKSTKYDSYTGVDTTIDHATLGEDASVKFNDTNNKAKIYETDLTIYESGGKNGEITGGIKVKAVLEEVMLVGTNYQVRGYYFIIADGQTRTDGTAVQLQGSGFNPKNGKFINGTGAAVQYKLRTNAPK
jgi:hypothetical protein